MKKLIIAITTALITMSMIGCGAKTETETQELDKSNEPQVHMDAFGRTKPEKTDRKEDVQEWENTVATSSDISSDDAIRFNSVIEKFSGDEDKKLKPLKLLGTKTDGNGMTTYLYLAYMDEEDPADERYALAVLAPYEEEYVLESNVKIDAENLRITMGTSDEEVRGWYYTENVGKPLTTDATDDVVDKLAEGTQAIAVLGKKVEGNSYEILCFQYTDTGERVLDVVTATVNEDGTLTPDDARHLDLSMYIMNMDLLKPSSIRPEQEYSNETYVEEQPQEEQWTEQTYTEEPQEQTW